MNQIESIGDMVSTREAARLLGMNREYLRQQTRKGVIKTVLFGRSLLIPRAELERFQRERMR
jgi:excisionase family DNA binding protein